MQIIMIHTALLVTIIILFAGVISEGILIKKYKRLDKKNKIFVASFTHDLKSPVNAQINMLNLLLKGQFGVLNSQQNEMLKLICESTKYLSNLVNTLLISYKCDSHNLVLKLSKFDIAQVVESICEEEQYLASTKNQNIIFNCEPDYPYIINADKLQIRRVISNLISNSITYGLNNSDIIVELSSSQKGYEFCVKNEILPLTQEELHELFFNFQNNDNSLWQNTNTGLGLYISKKIIDLHKGKFYAGILKDGMFSCGFIIKQCKTLPFKSNYKSLKNLHFTYPKR